MMVINKIKMSYKINCNLFDSFEDFPRKCLDEKLFSVGPQTLLRFRPCADPESCHRGSNTDGFFS